jgi:hypothetical protein
MSDCARDPNGTRRDLSYARGFAYGVKIRQWGSVETVTDAMRNWRERDVLGAESPSRAYWLGFLRGSRAA